MTTHSGSTYEFMKSSICTVGTAAMLLALTRTMHDEEVAKRLVAQKGLRSVVTEFGGQTTINCFHEKVNNAVIGAGLNSGLIQKSAKDIHALIHATEEAKQGILAGMKTNQSLALKIALVRDNDWLAVAMFGSSAVHYMTNHDRAGLGFMHI